MKIKRKIRTVKYIEEADKWLSVNDLKQAINDNKTIEDLIIEFYEQNGDN